ncbi:hypothetical protein [Achromobacter phage tuull]|nr:hypothetical protein [Achromobacter phage tuull]
MVPSNEGGVCLRRRRRGAHPYFGVAAPQL